MWELIVIVVVVAALRFGYWRGRRDFFSELSSSVRMGDYHRLRASDIKEELEEKTTCAILLQEQNEKLYQVCSEHERQAGEQDGKIKKLVNQKKSSEVRTGLIVEQMAPFLEGFPYNPKDAVFLGKPIDFLVFGPDGLHFVEVKSGKSQLTTTQRKIRDMVEANNVTFETYRIKGE